MATISQYNAPQGLAIEPSETGEVSQVRAGARVAELGNEAARQINSGTEAVKQMGQRWTQHLEQQDAINGTKDYAHRLNDLSTQVPAFVAANKDDPALFQRLQDELVNPSMQAHMDAMTTPQGREHAAGRAAQASMHFNELAIRDASTIQGITMTASMQDAKNTFSHILGDHPDMLPLVKQNYALGLNAAMGKVNNMEPTERARVTAQELEKSNSEFDNAAFGSLLNRNPAQAAAAARSGVFSSIPQSRVEAEVHKATVEQTQLQRQKIEFDNQQTRMRQQSNEAAAMSGIIADPLNPNTRQSISTGLAKGDLSAPMGEALLGVATRERKNAETGESAPVDPATVQSLKSGIFADNSNPNKTTDTSIMQSWANGKIDKTNADNLTTMLHRVEGDKDTKDLVSWSNDLVEKRLNGFIIPTTGLGAVPGGTAQQRLNLGNLKTDLNQFIADARTGGKDSFTIKNVLVPQWVKQHIGSYTSKPMSPADAVKALTGGSEPPDFNNQQRSNVDTTRQPGETTPQYASRVRQAGQAINNPDLQWKPGDTMDGYAARVAGISAKLPARPARTSFTYEGPSARASNPAAGWDPIPVADKTLPTEAQVFLPVLAGGESNGYTAKNPGSTAHDRYQFINETGNQEAGRLGIADQHKPENQDQMAWNLSSRTYYEATGRSLRDAIKSGRSDEQIAFTLNKVWPSLPGGSQENTSMAEWTGRMAAARKSMGVK